MRQYPRAIHRLAAAFFVSDVVGSVLANVCLWHGARLGKRRNTNFPLINPRQAFVILKYHEDHQLPQTMKMRNDPNDRML